MKFKANKTEIRQVMLNLLKNSFEAMPYGGAIQIQTGMNESDNKKNIEIISRIQEKELSLKISMIYFCRSIRQKTAIMEISAWDCQFRTAL